MESTQGFGSGAAGPDRRSARARHPQPRPLRRAAVGVRRQPRAGERRDRPAGAGRGGVRATKARGGSRACARASPASTPPSAPSRCATRRWAPLGGLPPGRSRRFGTLVAGAALGDPRDSQPAPRRPTGPARPSSGCARPRRGSARERIRRYAAARERVQSGRAPSCPARSPRPARRRRPRASGRRRRRCPARRARPRTRARPRARRARGPTARSSLTSPSSRISAGAGDHEVGLLLLAVAVAHRAAEVRGVAPVAHADVARAHRPAAEAALEALDAAVERVLHFHEVQMRMLGHARKLSTRLPL